MQSTAVYATAAVLLGRPKFCQAAMKKKMGRSTSSPSDMVPFNAKHFGLVNHGYVVLDCVYIYMYTYTVYIYI